MTAITGAEVRQARKYLHDHKVQTTDISPRDFAASAKELGKPFRDTLRYLALLLSGGSGVGPSKIATANKDRLDPIQALGDTGKDLQEGPNGPAG
jgi:hypothetical protein